MSVVRQHGKSTIKHLGEDVDVLYRTGSTVQKRGSGTLVTHRCGHQLVGQRGRDDGAEFVLRTLEDVNKTELSIYTTDKEPLFLSGRDARALLNLLQLHFQEKK